MSVVQPIKPSVAVKTGDPNLGPGPQIRRDFPVWHFAMVNDEARNQAIERSIAELDLKGKTVVEIGSGTGLIALLFAKHGAERIVSCEMNANLANVARRITAATPYHDRIRIISESSTSAIARGLLPARPDIIFTETIDCGVVGEGFMSVAEDIADIAGPDTHIMPGSITQTAHLIESAGLANLNRAGSACGFDLRILNEFSTGNYFPVHAELFEHRLLSEPVVQRIYKYRNCPIAKAKRVTVSRSGTAHGLLSWFAADFGAAAVSNQPHSGSHWHQAFHPFPDEISLEEGETVSTLIDDEGFAWVARDG